MKALKFVKPTFVHRSGLEVDGMACTWESMRQIAFGIGRGPLRVARVWETPHDNYLIEAQQKVLRDGAAEYESLYAVANWRQAVLFTAKCGSMKWSGELVDEMLEGA